VTDVIVVAGTGTEVGKTWVTAGLVRYLKDNVPIVVRKPVQSFDPASGPTDADVLAEAANVEAHEVCPPHRWYELPMAPPMAAEALGLPPIAMVDLMAEITLPNIGLALVESVGGVRSPITDDGDTVDLIEALDPRLVVLVADAGLGTINSVVLSMAALDRWPVVTFLNRFDENDRLHVLNQRWLQEAEAVETITDIRRLAARIQRATRKEGIRST
jgi:dethiobiotin synthetase